MRIYLQVILLVASHLLCCLEAKPLAPFGDPLTQFAVQEKPTPTADSFMTVTPRSPSVFQVPSPDPYQTAQTNEWLWRGWTVPNPTGERISEAFEDWLELIQKAHTAAHDSSESFTRWFGKNSNVQVMRVLVRMALPNASGTWTARPVIASAINEATDFLGDCIETQAAYMVPDEGRFHMCPLAMARPDLPHIRCSAIDPSIDLKAKSVASILLHEFTHWDEIGEAVLGKRIEDKATQPYDCFRLSDEDKLINAENYALLANDAYFSELCGDRVDPPAPTSIPDQL